MCVPLAAADTTGGDTPPRARATLKTFLQECVPSACRKLTSLPLLFIIHGASEASCPPRSAHILLSHRCRSRTNHLDFYFYDPPSPHTTTIMNTEANNS